MLTMPFHTPQLHTASHFLDINQERAVKAEVSQGFKMQTAVHLKKKKKISLSRTG